MGGSSPSMDTQCGLETADHNAWMGYRRVRFCRGGSALQSNSLEKLFRMSKNALIACMGVRNEWMHHLICANAAADDPAMDPTVCCCCCSSGMDSKNCGRENTWPAAAARAAATSIGAVSAGCRCCCVSSSAEEGTDWDDVMDAEAARQAGAAAARSPPAWRPPSAWPRPRRSRPRPTTVSMSGRREGSGVQHSSTSAAIHRVPAAPAVISAKTSSSHIRTPMQHTSARAA